MVLKFHVISYRPKLKFIDVCETRTDTLFLVIWLVIIAFAITISYFSQQITVIGVGLVNI